MRRFNLNVLKHLLSVNIVLLLSISLTLIGFSSISVSAASVPDGATVVVAGSDYQLSDTDKLAINTTALFQRIKDSGYSTVHGFLFAGDYTTKTSKKESVVREGREALQAAFRGVFGSEADEVYVQGNHDSDIGTAGMSPSGANDTDNYGVFVINEDDYMSKASSSGDDEETVKLTATNLKQYLEEKQQEGYAKPIFVVSHLPLHISMRTYSDGDTRYANYIFDVLNEAGNAGLNIIYLFGHNHSSGYDNYLGGGAIFLEKGSNINIAQMSKTDYKVETLAFTYMNAGYVGSYSTSAEGADKSLTMTVFTITDYYVTIERYDADGLHNLKSCGVYKSESEQTKQTYSPDTTVVPSPKTVALVKQKPGIYGNITGYEGTNKLKVTLTSESGKVAELTPTKESEGYSYWFENVADGDYTLTVSAPDSTDADYFTNSYSVSLSRSCRQDMIICRLGDTNCDGKVSAADITRLARHVAKISEESDEYKLNMFNTDRKGGIDSSDITHLARYVSRIIDKL